MNLQHPPPPPPTNPDKHVATGVERYHRDTLVQSVFLDVQKLVRTCESQTDLSKYDICMILH